MRNGDNLESKTYDEDGIQRTDFRILGVLPSGQTIKIVFYDCSTRKLRLYSIYLVIMDKRKSEANTTLRYTGKDGVLGLFWARDRIRDFEEFLRENDDGRKTMILTQWENNTRRDIYYRGLKNIGYKYGYLFGRKCICKTI